MSTIVSFCVFFTGIAASVAAGIPLYYPLALGVIVFSLDAFWHRFKPVDILKMIVKGASGAFPVIRIFILIGIMTGLWRSSGTIAFFVYYGIKFIPAQLFLLFAFLLPALISYFMGSLFGTVSTVGVVLLVMGQSSGINTAILCGAIISGAIVGDRMAPTSGCCNLIATVTKTKVSDILKGLWARAVLPLGLSAVIFTTLSIINPAQSIDSAITQDILATYDLDLWLMFPAFLVLILPLFKVNVRASIAVSSFSAALITCFVQKDSLLSMLKSAILGYTPKGDGAFCQVIGGGGLVSMISVAIIVILACSCTGIFNGTGMLDGVKNILHKLSQKAGLFPTTLLFSLFANMAFCNQTISIIITEQMVRDIYQNAGKHGKTLAYHMADSTAVIGAFVPWCLMCSVPLTAMLGGPLTAIAFFLYPMLQILCSLLFDLLHRYSYN